MKKDKEPDQDELRAEYKRSDFPGGLELVFHSMIDYFFLSGLWVSA